MLHTQVKAKTKSKYAATLLDTKGPEIRTAMLRDGKDIELEAGQKITIEAVGAEYTKWEGYKDPATGETHIGLSYEKLCSSVKPGNKILLADGSISITVDQITSPRTLVGTVLNSKKLGQRKNCNLPGVKVDIPVLTDKDIDDLKNFAAKHKMDFVAASFVQSAADVQFIRRVLDEAGGQGVKIISKIENLEGLNNYDEILRESDGIMVARGDLGMEIPSEKVGSAGRCPIGDKWCRLRFACGQCYVRTMQLRHPALLWLAKRSSSCLCPPSAVPQVPVAQKMMITKANIAGKFVICATQMLESMISNPRPTRAEMTDVANAVYDGVDCVMLSGKRCCRRQGAPTHRLCWAPPAPLGSRRTVPAPDSLAPGRLVCWYCNTAPKPRSN